MAEPTTFLAELPDPIPASAIVPMVEMIQIENLAAGADIAARPEWVAPQRGADLLRAGIVLKGSAAGVDAGNTAVIALADGAGNAIVSKTYDDDPAPPASGTYDNLGTLHATHRRMTGNEVLTVAVTQGATADLPAFVVVLEWAPR